MTETKGIYQLAIDCGRMGHIDGVFVATNLEIEAIRGIRIYFGEVLGKHSEVVAVMDCVNLSLVTEDTTAVDVFERFGLSNGYTPFDYLYDEKDDEYKAKLARLRGAK